MGTAGTVGEIEELRRQVARLEKINAALMDRVERSSDIHGGAFSMFETAITLEAMVRDRTGALEDTLDRLNNANAELVDLNHQLEEAKNEAETANRSKTSFLAAASHDLLQPLNAARLFVSAMEGQEMPARSRSLVQQASTALDSVEDLLEALFEISRLDAGAVQPEITDFPLDSILRTLRIEFAPLAAAGGLEFDVPETDLWVRSDHRLLRRVLQNFVSNAIRYTEQGKVSVELRDMSGHVVIIVRDTGPGIAAADREEIFEEFRRLDRAKKIPGKGLGLAIARRVSTMLDHEIGLESVPGKGAAFSIRLPRVAPVAITCEEPAAAVGGSGGSGGSGGLVLVVDNDPAILSGMEALLENWGLDVVAVRDPSDPAAQSALTQGPAMFIVDYHLDDELTGEKAIAMLRGKAGAHVPAMIITADRCEETKAHLAGLSLPVLNKPVKPAKLRALLRQLEIL